jgi:hypothetical protein
MIVSEIKLYELLKSRLGEQEAEAFVDILEKKVENKFSDEKNTIVGEIDARISASKADMIKWMFIFWIGQIAATFGFILLFLKK